MIARAKERVSTALRKAGRQKAVGWIVDKSLNYKKQYRIQRLEKKLSDAWGLGCDRNGAGYRARLKRLCQFMSSLDPDNATAMARNSSFTRFRDSLDPQKALPSGARGNSVALLLKLKNDLKNVAAIRGNDLMESLDALRKWQIGHHDKALTKSLEALGALPANLTQPEEDPLGCLKELQELLHDLQPSKASQDQIAEMWRPWRECVKDCLNDWKWAHRQVLILLARECLEEKPISRKSYKLAAVAESALVAAIQALEEDGFLRPWAEELYELLARSSLHRTNPPEDQLQDENERSKLNGSALAYARRAVEIAPSRASARLVLLEALAHYGDPDEMATQAEIARDLDSSPETLRTIGQCFWNRVASLPVKSHRRRVLRQAVTFFKSAVLQTESAPLDTKSPRVQMQSHGWAHYWLGRFEHERGRYEEAVGHLRTASALEFQPLDSDIQLALACSFARDRHRADRVFDQVRAKIEQMRRQALVPPGGEERSLDDFELDTWLSYALLCVDWDPDRALRYAARAEDLLRRANREKGDLLASLHEARGRAFLTKNDLVQAVAELKTAVLMSVDGGAPCYLGLAYAAQAAQAKIDSPERAEGLRRAWEAYRLARESDVRGRYRRDTWALRGQLQKIEKPAGGLEAQPSQPAKKQSAPAPSGAVAG